MKLWAGLGNPDPSMSSQRHNIGFMALDRIHGRYGFSPWRSRFAGHVSEGVLEGEKILLLKPATFMNLSGQSVQPAAAFYRLNPEDLIIFHDEMALKFGRLRFKRGGGPAGHNGLRSIDRHLGDQNYGRVRLGIGHPGDRGAVVGHVLGDFSSAERPFLSDWMDELAALAPLLATAGQADLFATRANEWAKPRLADG